MPLPLVSERAGRRRASVGMTARTPLSAAATGWCHAAVRPGKQ
jgi:hypothetical protein